MTRSTLFKPTFLVAITIGLIGLVFKIMHLPGGIIMIGASLILTLVYIFMALYEIYGSSRITMNEKIMWTVGFIVFNTITGFLYFFIGRPRIMHEYKILNQPE